MADDTRDGGSSTSTQVGEDAASLASTVLEEESKREAEQIARSTQQLLPDDLLPGVGAEQMSFREAVKSGGIGMLAIIPLLGLVEEFDRVAIAVLAPDIQKTLNVSDTVLIGIASFGGIALVLGSIPLAWLADRVKRVRIVGFASIFWGLAVILQGLAVNPFQMFCARAVTGLGQSNHLPVHSALLADNYPVQARGRVFAFEGMARPLGLLAGPFLAGFIADTAGGDEGWRWAFFIFAIPPMILALFTLLLKEPARGRNEQLIVLGEELEPAQVGKELPVSISSAFARLKKIRTFYYICVGIGMLGFALVAAPVQISQLLEKSYHKEAFTRGWIISLTWLASLVSIPIAGSFMDKLFRKDPQKMLRAAGGFILAYGVIMTISLRFTSLWPLIVGISLANACTSAAFVSIGPTVGAVAPYRMRSQAFAIVPLFIFLMGGFFGGLIAGGLSDAYGQRTALTVVIPPAALVGGLLIIYGSRFMKRDISLAVEELIEEQDEMKRMSADPEHIPALQLRNLDYSYGPVQVLFDVGFEVEKGEVLALLGNNGAGKSTVLRAISGLGIPDRGVIRLHGRTLTYVDAEVRFGQGIVQLRGGSGIFPELTIDDNLRSSMLATKVEEDVYNERLTNVMSLFPMLANRRNELARSLSGGQQQMLALAMALMHKPDVLLIDELSLGLAPVVVQELIRVVEQLKADGQTMIIVEQSLNIALSLADRAVFMEKGRVRFEGPARQLAERDDLVRAVFLGGEEG
jgi:ABC-type branched-subunit amino acid transport system ATPase component/predicted MFS family arabinose efflux permease